MIRITPFSFVELKDGKAKAGINLSTKDKLASGKIENIINTSCELYEVVTDKGIFITDKSTKIYDPFEKKNIKICDLKKGNSTIVYSNPIQKKTKISVTKTAMYNLGHYNGQSLVYGKMDVFSEYVFNHSKLRLLYYISGFIDSAFKINRQGYFLKTKKTNVIEGLCKLLMDLRIEFYLSTNNQKYYTIRIPKKAYPKFSESKTNLESEAIVATILKVNKIKGLQTCVQISTNTIILNNFLLKK